MQGMKKAAVMLTAAYVLFDSSGEAALASTGKDQRPPLPQRSETEDTAATK